MSHVIYNESCDPLGVVCVSYGQLCDSRLRGHCRSLLCVCCVCAQFALLAQGGLYGYLEDFSGQRLHTRELVSIVFIPLHASVSFPIYIFKMEASPELSLSVQLSEAE